MLIIDHQRRITLRNRSGEALLERRDLVSDVHGKLACLDDASDSELARAMRDLEASQRRSENGATDRRVVWLRRCNGSGAAATLHALRPSSEEVPAHVLFTVFETGVMADIDTGLLTTLFQLTAAEARLTALIARGATTEECASQLGVKTSTLRTQLSSIYDKTGATGKSDLVRLVLSSCAI